jgi:FixJ family two-component response regulator
LRNGVHAILHKPFTQYELLHILNRAISLQGKTSGMSGSPVLEKVRS